MNEFLQIRLLQVLPIGWNLGGGLLLIPLLPLAGFLLLGLFGRKYIKNSAGIIGTFLLLISTAYQYAQPMDTFLNLGK